MALWCVLKLANIFGPVNLKVYGDSRVTIKWALGHFKLNVTNLRHCCIHTQREISLQHNISFGHIYRENKSMVDKLSKQALEGSEGHLIWDEWLENVIVDCGDIYFFD